MQLDYLDGIATFIAVAEEKSFSAGAIKLGVSPSALGQAIRNLERRVGLASIRNPKIFLVVARGFEPPITSTPQKSTIAPSYG